MHVERAFSNLAILIVGSMTAMVAFVSTRLNHIYFYVLAAACIVLVLVVAASAFRRLARRIPAVLGKAIAPRWEIARRSAKPIVNILDERKLKSRLGRPTNEQSCERRANAA
jgi:hypothetical protein